MELVDLSEKSLDELSAFITEAEGTYALRSYDQGRALREISQRKLYDGKAKTFEAFARRLFGYDKVHLYRLIDHAEVCDAVYDLDCGIPNERKSRVLKNIGLANSLRATWQFASRKDVRGKDLERVVTAVAAAGAVNDAEIIRLAEAALAAQLPAPSKRKKKSFEASMIDTFWAKRPDVNHVAHAIRESGHYDAIVTYVREILNSLSDQAAAVDAAERIVGDFASQEAMVSA